jgi:hypothetical protein
MFIARSRGFVSWWRTETGGEAARLPCAGIIQIRSMGMISAARQKFPAAPLGLNFRNYQGCGVGASWAGRQVDAAFRVLRRDLDINIGNSRTV